MSSKKKSAASADANANATQATTSAAATDDDGGKKTKYASRGRNVTSWLEKTFGEGTGEDWPRALDEVWPLLQDLFRKHAMNLRDVRCYVFRLGGPAETPVSPPFDASCMDTERPSEAAQTYLEDFYHLPSAENGVGAANYRVAFKDKKSGLQILAAEMALLHPKEILAIRRAHRRTPEDQQPAYDALPPLSHTAPRPAPIPTTSGAPNGAIDPQYMLQALNDIRIDMAAHKAQTPEIIAGVLKALGHVDARAATQAATPQQPTPPSSTFESTVDATVEVLKRLGIAKEVQAPNAGAATASDGVEKLADDVERTFRAKERIDVVVRRYKKLFAGDDDGETTSSATTSPAASESSSVAPTPPEQKAPFRGLKIDGFPKLNGQDVLWPVDENGNFSLKGVPWVNPELAKEFFQTVREGGKPLLDLLQRWLEQQVPPAKEEEQHATTNGVNGAAHPDVTSDVPNDARDANPGDGSNGWGAAS